MKWQRGSVPDRGGTYLVIRNKKPDVLQYAKSKTSLRKLGLDYMPDGVWYRNVGSAYYFFYDIEYFMTCPRLPKEAKTDDERTNG